MPIDTSTLLRFSLIPLSILTFSIIMSSLCGNTWLYSYKEVTPFIDIETRIGLWFVCLTQYDYGIGKTTCIASDTDVPDYFQATRAFLILTTMPSLVTMVAAVVINCNQKYKGFVCGIPFALTAFFLVIGMSSFTGSVNANDGNTVDYSIYSYGWTHNIGWLAFPLTVAGTIISFVHGLPSLLDRNVDYQN